MAAPDRQKQWYILRYVKSVPSGVKQSAEAVVDRFNRSENAELDLFAPTIVKVVHREGTSSSEATLTPSSTCVACKTDSHSFSTMVPKADTP